MWQLVLATIKTQRHELTCSILAAICPLTISLLDLEKNLGQFWGYKGFWAHSAANVIMPKNVGNLGSELAEWKMTGRLGYLVQTGRFSWAAPGQ